VHAWPSVKMVVSTTKISYVRVDSANQVYEMIPQSVLIGLVVAVVAYFLQQRSWRHNKKEEVRQREFEACMNIIENLARAFDKRISATSEFIGCVDRGEVTLDELQDYRSSVREWMHDFSSFKTKIYHYFGKDKMLEFENSVHASLREVSDITLRTYRLGKENLSSKHLVEHNSCSARLYGARYKAYRFLAVLNEMTANEETGRISLYDNVHVGNLDLISRTYLVQRLLGMRS